MKNIPEYNGRPFQGTPHLRLKRIRKEPRHKIRQLLRSFISLDGIQPGHKDLNDDPNTKDPGSSSTP